MQQTQAQRAANMKPSRIPEISKTTEKSGLISFARGLPSPNTRPLTRPR